ncbi:MAG: phosphoenolpyruvate carboxylase [Rickettsiales bacterium]|nr:phosphoenolpyruvate carboxylase [Rickettsiales bacterium]
MQPSVLLKSHDHLVLVRTLSDQLIDVIRKDDTLGGDLIADKMTQLRDTVWPKEGSPALNEEQKEAAYQAVLTGLDTTGQKQLFDAYAHMGHLYDIASLTARENFFEELRTKNELIPGGVRAFVTGKGGPQTASEAVSLLNKPVFEIIMTMHPTNTNTLESMKKQRALSIAVQSGDMEATQAAIKDFVTTPLLQHDKDGNDINLTVRDETNIVLNFLNNIYEDLPKVYFRYDRPMGQEYDDSYDAKQLNLHMNLGSWGSSGDKDGNASVTAETTLEAIGLHTQAILENYVKELGALENKTPELEKWHKDLSRILQDVNKVMPELKALCDETDKSRAAIQKHEKDLADGKITETDEEKPTRLAKEEADAKRFAERFETLSGRLRDIRSGLSEEKKAEFIATLEAQCPALQRTETKQPLDNPTLNLLRRVRTFGFSFSKIEYRETAEEYARVLGTMIEGYNDKSPEERGALLSSLIKSGEASALYEKAKQDIITHGANKKYISQDEDKPYSRDAALPIAYHTIRRMELARDFPDMIKDNVLAECGRLKGNPTDKAIEAQGEANLLEALLLQKASVSADGRIAKLGIVPLFEEPDTMKNVTGIMKRAYDNEVYKTHIDELKERNHGKVTQQIQIAHSDNARRSGLQAARAFIHEAHKKVRKLNDEYGIETQFFEGGSISDAYRNGVRSISATTNAFELYDFAKYTFQGGDLLNYFNNPASNERIFTRNFVEPASRISKWESNRDALRKWRQEHPGVAEPTTLDDVAIEALKRTLDDYLPPADTSKTIVGKIYDFTTKTMGVLLDVLDYKGETKAGNRGSRAAKRGGFGKVDSTQLGRVIEPVEIESVRTIGFSEGWQHAAIIPSWIGSIGLLDYLKEAGSKFKEVFSNFGDVDPEQGLSAEQLRILYQQSAAFRDAQDRSAFGIALTDPRAFERIRKNIASYEDDVGDNKTYKESILGIDGSDGRPKQKGYLDHIIDTFKKAGKTAYEARMGEDFGTDDVNHMSQKIATDALTHLSSDIGRKTSFRDFLIYAKPKLKEQNLAPELEDHIRGLMHNAGDTVVHGRWPTADDPAYGTKRVEDVRRKTAAATLQQSP